MTEKPVIKVIIIDIGGVVLKWNDSIVYSYIAKKNHISLIKLKKAGNKIMPLYELGLITEHELWHRIAKQVGHINDFRGIWLGHFDAYAKKNKSVIRLIKKLRKNGYKTATITNVIKPHYNYNKQTGLYKMFNKTFASCILHKRKPSITIYRYAAKKLYIEPKECLFIDNIKENITGARKAGMQTLIFKNSKQMKSELKKRGVKI